MLASVFNSFHTQLFKLFLFLLWRIKNKNLYCLNKNLNICGTKKKNLQIHWIGKFYIKKCIFSWVGCITDYFSSCFYIIEDWRLQSLLPRWTKTTKNISKKYLKIFSIYIKLVTFLWFGYFPFVSITCHVFRTCYDFNSPYQDLTKEYHKADPAGVLRLVSECRLSEMRNKEKLKCFEFFKLAWTQFYSFHKKKNILFLQFTQRTLSPSNYNRCFSLQ